MFERISSVPIYQWQPFVQTPSLNPDANLDLEEGETIYEDQWAKEWVLFLKLILLSLPIAVLILFIQVYDNNVFPSHEVRTRLNPLPIPGNPQLNYEESDRVEKLNYWGSDLWYYQHWVRKNLFYPLAFTAAALISHYMLLLGNATVLKAVFNRSKDVVFVWFTNGITKNVKVYELHYLEKPLPSIVDSWKYYSFINGNQDSYHPIIDTRTQTEFYFKSNPNYWNHDVRKYFDDNTSTYWKGLRSKDINKGIFLDNSFTVSAEEYQQEVDIQKEIEEAVTKLGPLQKHDYEHNFKYQLSKRLNENRLNLIANH